MQAYAPRACAIIFSFSSPPRDKHSARYQNLRRPPHSRPVWRDFVSPSCTTGSGAIDRRRDAPLRRCQADTRGDRTVTSTRTCRHRCRAASSRSDAGLVVEIRTRSAAPPSAQSVMTNSVAHTCSVAGRHRFRNPDDFIDAVMHRGRCGDHCRPTFPHDGQAARRNSP